jgi:hypothetical protein
LKTILLASLIALSMLVCVEAMAQGRPGGGRGGGGEMGREGQRKNSENRPATPVPGASEAYSALERELPSLKVDLLLTAEQVEAWALLERDIRGAAELERYRQRQLMGLRDVSREPPTALGLMGMLADLDRRKADASADVRLHLEGLFSRLDDRQKQMLDRRVAQSQTEPLGR